MNFSLLDLHEDPAGIASAQNVAQAYRKIAESKAPFLSRGDNSGTDGILYFGVISH